MPELTKPQVLDELSRALEAIRAFITDGIDTQHPSTGMLGNLYGALKETSNASRALSWLQAGASNASNTVADDSRNS